MHAHRERLVDAEGARADGQAGWPPEPFLAQSGTAQRAPAGRAVEARVPAASREHVSRIIVHFVMVPHLVLLPAIDGDLSLRDVEADEAFAWRFNLFEPEHQLADEI